jgi:hypothetical protein
MLVKLIVGAMGHHRLLIIVRVTAEASITLELHITCRYTDCNEITENCCWCQTKLLRVFIKDAESLTIMGDSGMQYTTLSNLGVNWSVLNSFCILIRKLK